MQKSEMNLKGHPTDHAYVEDAVESDMCGVCGWCVPAEAPSSNPGTGRECWVLWNINPPFPYMETAREKPSKKPGKGQEWRHMVEVPASPPAPGREWWLKTAWNPKHGEYAYAISETEPRNSSGEPIKKGYVHVREVVGAVPQGEGPAAAPGARIVKAAKEYVQANRNLIAAKGRGVGVRDRINLEEMEDVAWTTLCAAVDGWNPAPPDEAPAPASPGTVQAPDAGPDLEAIGQALDLLRVTLGARVTVSQAEIGTKADLALSRLRAGAPSAGRPAKPKLGEYPHSLDDCIKYMDFLAIEGIADGSRERVGGMCLSTAKHLSRLKEIESAGRPMTWTRAKPDCDLCKGTGWYGDRGPGRKGNSEYQPCECTQRPPKTSAAKSGEGASPDPAPCGTCDGTGKVDSGGQDGAGNWIERDCPECRPPAPIREAKADPARQDALRALAEDLLRKAIGIAEEPSPKWYKNNDEKIAAIKALKDRWDARALHIIKTIPLRAPESDAAAQGKREG